MSLHVPTLLAFEQLRNPVLTEAFVAITALGSLFTALIIVYTLYHFGHRRPAILAAASVAVGGVIEKLLNLVFMRARPDVVPVVIDYYMQGPSFPSGHATIAFALATILELELEGSNYYFFLLAALVAVSRLYLGVHYPGDVVAGALLGLAAGYAVHRYSRTILGFAETIGFKR